MHSRPTAQSSRSMQPPHHLKQPPPAVASAEPAKSALPARCLAWLRATRHLASPRVSTASCTTLPDTVVSTGGILSCHTWEGGGRWWHPAGRNQPAGPRQPHHRDPQGQQCQPKGCGLIRRSWREGLEEAHGLSGCLALTTSETLSAGVRFSELWSEQRTLELGLM